MEPAIIVRDLSKSFGKVRAVAGISFSVNAGEIYGLIGPDGAGKTTLFRLLTTLLLPDSGSAQVAGYDIRKQFYDIRRRVGYMPGHFSLYPDLSVRENLDFFATLFGLKKEDNMDLIRPIYEQIAPFGDRKAANLSGGMKQKLALCCALIHYPQVLFLDEPTTGVDPVSRIEFWEMLRFLRSRNIAILVSTPYMDEAAKCDRIALMRAGELLQQDTPQAIIAGYGEPLWGVEGERPGRMLFFLRDQPEVKSCFSFGDRLHLTFYEPYAESNRLIEQRLAEQGFRANIFAIEPGIEDCFIKRLGI